VILEIILRDSLGAILRGRANATSEVSAFAPISVDKRLRCKWT
jgi:hypothetical protein